MQGGRGCPFGPQLALPNSWPPSLNWGSWIGSTTNCGRLHTAWFPPFEAVVDFHADPFLNKVRIAARMLFEFIEKFEGLNVIGSQGPRSLP